MKIDVLTLFPGMFTGPLDESIVGRAREMQRLELQVHNLRDYTHDRHRTVDDRPFGGGPGMVLKPEPIFEAVENLAGENTRVILLTPSGRLFSQQIARELAAQPHLLLICGSYEGIDERVHEALADDELSIGDYVLTNGALPAMVVIDSVARLLPGVLMCNAGLKFICKDVHLRVERADTAFTRGYKKNEVFTCPVAHHDGNYFADAETLARIEGEGQVAFRYCGPDTGVEPEWCPNGSLNNIAGVYNEKGNVLGLMPHPEDATEKLVGGLGGMPLFTGIAASIGASQGSFGGASA